MAAGHTVSRHKQHLLALLSFFERVVESVPFWWGICLTYAGILAFSARHLMNPDGLSYVDMASEALHSGPCALINGLWSPGYPALLSLAFALFHPSPAQEFPFVHFVNFLIFALTLWAFQFFLVRWRLYTNAFRSMADEDMRFIVPFAYCTFLWFTLEHIGLRFVTPDLCVAAVVFLAAGIACRLGLPDSSRKHYVALGLAFGLGYYFKAPLFPLGVVLLGGFLLYPPSRGITRRKLLLSLLIFLLAAAPLVTALSSRAGKLSFGEAGRLNYAWYVNGLHPFIGWIGSEQGQPFSSVQHDLQPQAASANDAHTSGVPEHPPRRLMEKPLILEFGSPIKGTFPLWYDPSYWYAGANVRFDLRKQINVLGGSLEEYKTIFHQTRVLFYGAAVLSFVAACRKRFPNVTLREFWLLAWPVAAMLMYALVHLETRYIAPFLVLLWLAIYSAVFSRVDRRIAVTVCVVLIGLLMVPLSDDVAAENARATNELLSSSQPDYQAIAAGLRNLGLQGGDCLAVVGYPFDPFYARYAGLRVVANIPATDEFWNLSAPELKSVAERLTQIGVKAIVAENRPDVSTVANWQDMKISESKRFSVLLLEKPLTDSTPEVSPPFGAPRLANESRR